MHPKDVCFYGHRTLMAALQDLPDAAWHAPEACGVWTVKDIMAHLAATEAVLVDVLSAVMGSADTPRLAQYLSGPGWNDAEVAARHETTPAEVLAEYEGHHERAMELVAAVPPEIARRSGVLEWYGAEYDLEDYIAYGIYGHKREHAAQINVVRDRVG